LEVKVQSFEGLKIDKSRLKKLERFIINIKEGWEAKINGFQVLELRNHVLDTGNIGNACAFFKAEVEVVESIHASDSTADSSQSFIGEIFTPFKVQVKRLELLEFLETLSKSVHIKIPSLEIDGDRLEVGRASDGVKTIDHVTKTIGAIGSVGIMSDHAEFEFFKFFHVT